MSAEDALRAAGWTRHPAAACWVDPLVPDSTEPNIAAAMKVQRGRDAAVLAERERIAKRAEAKADNSIISWPEAMRIRGLERRKVLLAFAEELRGGGK